MIVLMIILIILMIILMIVIIIMLYFIILSVSKYNDIEINVNILIWIRIFPQRVMNMIYIRFGSILEWSENKEILIEIKEI
jgi:hypothetical protein